MPLIKIQSYPGMRQVFVAAEGIGHLSVIAYSTEGINRVALGTNAKQAEVCGVAYGSVSGTVSGKLLRAVTHGIVSGLICAVDVEAGDRVTCASAGKIAPINTVSPLVNLASGGILSGAVGISELGLVATSGALSSLAGIIPFNTARVLGKALASGFGLSGAGVPVLVTLGG